MWRGVIMSWLLLLLGIVLAAAGGGLIGLGIPINELSRGTTMILAGSFGLVGGLLLIGLAAVVAELARVARLLRTSPAIQPAQAAPTAQPPRLVETPAPAPQETVPVLEPAAPVAVPSLEPSANAIERLRSSTLRPERTMLEAEEVPLSPNGSHGHSVEPRFEPLPRTEPVPRSAGAAAVETREPRLDFLFRPRQPRQSQESLDALWQRRPSQERQLDTREELARTDVTADIAATAAPDVAPEPAVEGEPEHPAPYRQTATEPDRAVAILKSGVVDGMAYTLYADGSIEAQLPQGTVRFGSITELRAHIENRG